MTGDLEGASLGLAVTGDLEGASLGLAVTGDLEGKSLGTAVAGDFDGALIVIRLIEKVDCGMSTLPSSSSPASSGCAVGALAPQPKRGRYVGLSVG